MNYSSDTAATRSFNAISDFLSAFAPEVSGRSSDSVSNELQEALTSLAAGKLSEAEGRELSRELLANENAMQTLAGLISMHA